jgi:hypothetical protein
MSVSRITFAVAILLGCRVSERSDTGSGSAPSADPDPTPVNVEPKVEAPKAPELPKLPPPPPGKSAADNAFQEQIRDDQWAPTAEAEIHRRFGKVRGAKLEGAECRQNQCRLTIQGNQGEVSRAIADLEGSRGLHGYAKNILLTAPEKKADGTLVLRAFATFDR